jgi:uncharacterized protein YegL
MGLISRFLLASSMLLSCILPLQSQPILTFKRIEIQYPTIKLAFKVTCAGKFRTDLGPQHFTVHENGILMKNATIWCPQEDTCCVSVALVLDRSGSMEGEKLARVKTGALAYVDLMNIGGSACDETAVVSFSDDVTLDVGMTSNQALLRSAINGLETTGWTQAWDGVATGIQELSATAHNRCKAVIVLTDGGDNRSVFFKTVQSLIAYAQSQDVKVYTISYGPQSPRDEDNLRLLAEETGGVFFNSTDGSDLPQIYALIKNQINEAFRECYITYESTCPDGTMRTVELMLHDFCGGTTSQARTYIAPYDPSKFQTVGIGLGDAQVAGGQEVVVPLMLETPIDAVFSRSTFYVGYDGALVDLVGISTAGTLLDGVPVSWTRGGSSYQIRTDENVELHGSGVLLYLRFRAADIAAPAFSNLYLYEWKFLAYCLVPQMHHGRLELVPREPVLSCEVDAPDFLQWDDVRKEYIPNPFNVSVSIRNTGTREARWVRATLVTDTSVVELLSPATLVQSTTPAMINPGQTGTAAWQMRARKQGTLDSISVYFSIESENHQRIGCWKRILVGEALSSALVCRVESIDTVRFLEQYYDPQDFGIRVVVRNVGSGQTKQVRAQLLQDTRFTILSPSEQSLADTLRAQASAASDFTVRIHPRYDDGYDTIRVTVQGDDTSPTFCEHPIWVERVRMPVFDLTCSASVDSLVFSEQTYDYQPNPFKVTTVATNIGETFAEECQLMFAGPPRFTPIGSNLRPEGTMRIGDSRTETWMIRALPRTDAGWDTLVFQIIGRGGLGKAIVLGMCRVPIYIPAIRRPGYLLTCAGPDSLHYENNKYTPSPIPYSVTIVNVGNAAGRNLKPSIVLPPQMALAPGEVTEKFVGVIDPGRSVILTWLMLPEPRGADGSSRICVQVTDSLGASEQCCTDLFIPRTEAPLLMPSCWSVDTLFLDPSSGMYLGNPFPVTLNVTNVGIGRAEKVRATISVLGSFMRSPDTLTIVAGNLLPGNTFRFQWLVTALSRPAASSIPIVLTVIADNHPPVECTLSVYVQATAIPHLTVSCTSNPEDTLFFNWSTGDFTPTIADLSLKVHNVGDVRARNVSALLIAPPGIVLADGETTIKAIDPFSLEPGARGTAHWRFRAVRTPITERRTFTFIVRSDNAEEVSCNDDIYVEGSPKRMTLRLPENELFRYEQKRSIPVFIDSTIGKDLSIYSFRIAYDPQVISILYASNLGSLTGVGWVGTRMSNLQPGLIEVSDYTTGNPLATEAGVLTYLTVAGVYRGAPGSASYDRSPLHLDSATTVFNRGDIQVRTVDGSAYVTNECLEPLQAAPDATLEQNRPNPFNPQTSIAFSVNTPAWVRITVHDPLGKEVMRLVDGMVESGRHSVMLDASRLPSGMYFYTLHAGRTVETRRMLLTR